MNNPGLFKRKGLVRINKESIQDNPKLVLEALSTMLIVRAEHMYLYNYIEYQGYSELFDITEDFEAPSEYAAVFKDDKFAGWMLVDE